MEFELFDGDVMASSKQAEFTDLYEKNYRRIYCYVRALVLDPSDVDDVFQQVSLVLELRRDIRRRHRVFSTPLQETLLAEIQSSASADDERIEILVGCVEKLPSGDRDLLMRHYRDDVAVKQLATEAQRPVTSVHNSLRRIRELLLACVERELSREVVQ